MNHLAQFDILHIYSAKKYWVTDGITQSRSEQYTMKKLSISSCITNLSKQIIISQSPLICPWKRDRQAHPRGVLINLVLLFTTLVPDTYSDKKLLPGSWICIALCRTEKRQSLRFKKKGKFVKTCQVFSVKTLGTKYVCKLFFFKINNNKLNNWQHLNLWPVRRPVHAIEESKNFHIYTFSWISFTV